jgi:gamma-glutamyl-gamma-aminobutyraldehyde dehydrogenase/4-guanidinobutyraldehyde dehydrogenase/NAD-dependent aldehyde dehydrogenase
VECGGKSGHIILDDCSRLDDAATAAAYGIFFNQGEMCSAGSRLIVHKAVYQAVMDKILDIAAKMQPDNPLNPESPIGAMVGEEHTQQVEKYLEIGKTEATVAAGGARVHPVAGGCYIPPTVFTDVPVDARIAQEEIFGPVLCVTQIESAEEAVQVANNSIYGLAAGVWSDNVNTLHACTKALKAGVVYANCYDADDITVPFGGYKQSGIGRDKSLHAFDKYTEMKTTWLRLYS